MYTDWGSLLTEQSSLPLDMTLFDFTILPSPPAPQTLDLIPRKPALGTEDLMVEVIMESKEVSGPEAEPYLISNNLKLNRINEKILKEQLDLEPIQERKGSGYKFLIVDDNAINLIILTKLLKRVFKDCTVDSTPYPQHVLNTLFLSSEGQDVTLEDGNLMVNPEFDYDVLFFDIEMPLITGLQLALKIRGFQDFDELPIVAVTSCFSLEDCNVYEKAGIDLTIGKPLSSCSLSLEEVVDRVLASRRPDAQNTSASF